MANDIRGTFTDTATAQNEQPLQEPHTIRMGTPQEIEHDKVCNGLFKRLMQFYRFF